MADKNPLYDVPEDMINEIRRRLIADETAFQKSKDDTVYSSLWDHSLRVAHLCRTLALREGLDPLASFLAGIFHDIGKFDGGRYHEDDTSEEEIGSRHAAKMLTGTAMEPLIATVSEAMLSLYRDSKITSAVGRILYDADRLDKLGNSGIVNYVGKNALRGCFLNRKLIIDGSVELTYAFHAAASLKTDSAKLMARERAGRVREFFGLLLEEWEESGRESFSIINHALDGIATVLIRPDRCSCGGAYEVSSGIGDSVKCTQAVIEFFCPRCGDRTGFDFCLPVLLDSPGDAAAS